MRAEDPPPSTELVPHMVSATTVGLNRLAARCEPLVARFGEEVGPLVVEFSAELRAASQGFVHLETMEIGGMRSTPTAWAVTLERILQAFDAPAPQDGADMSDGWSLYFQLFPHPAIDTPERRTAYCAGDEW
jgi:hypothetical protein